MFNIKTVTTTALLTSAFAIAIPASAEPGTQVQTQIQASQLATPQGVKSVYEHLENVAITECAASGQTTLADQRTAKFCAENLLQEFIENVDNDDLTRLFKIENNG